MSAAIRTTNVFRIIFSEIQKFCKAWSRWCQAGWALRGECSGQGRGARGRSDGEWANVVRDHPEAAVDRVVEGGAERFHSVANGLAALPDREGWVGIHDAVRPLVEVDTIRRCYAAGEVHGGAIPVVPVKDTIRRIGERGSAPLDRATLRAVQTPQVFSLGPLREAYGVEYQSHFTDDASVWEASGRRLELVEGDLHNLKLTTPEDLLSAEAFLALRNRS